jgi:hypothetical protein
MCACLPQHPWLLIFSSRDHDRQSSDQNVSVQILSHAENRIICCQIFSDLPLKSAFERIFNVMQLILVKIKWKYLIQKFQDICLSYYYTYIVYLKSKPQILSWNYVFLICNFNKSAVFSNWNDILDLFLFMYTISHLIMFKDKQVLKIPKIARLSFGQA